jgi:hypothetical protein
MNHKAWVTHFGGDPGLLGKTFVDPMIALRHE